MSTDKLLDAICPSIVSKKSCDINMTVFMKQSWVIYKKQNKKDINNKTICRSEEEIS